MDIISIGVLAYNESQTISSMIRSLFAQSLFELAGQEYLIEVVVVPNGCTDDTANKARTCLSELIKEDRYQDVRWKVSELERGDKCGAWNHFVHQASDPQSSFFILADADIQIKHPDTLKNMVLGLEANPKACASISKPEKDTFYKSKKSLFERLSCMISRSMQKSGIPSELVVPDEVYYICGQLYCVRGEELRRIWLPIGHPVEDGFISSQLTSRHFRHPRVGTRVMKVGSAFHLFTPESQFSRWLHHERRISIGAAVNTSLRNFFYAQVDAIPDVGQWIKKEQEKNPNWLHSFMKERVDRGDALLGLSWPLRRVRELPKMNRLKAIIMAPIFLALLPLDFLVYRQSLSLIKQGKGVGFW